MPGTPIMAKNPVGQIKDLRCNAFDHLSVHNNTAEGTPSNVADSNSMFRTMTYGYDEANNIQRPIKCDADGHMKCELTSAVDVAIGDVEMIANTNGDGSGTKKHTLCDSSGRLQVSVLGNEESDGSGASRHLHLDGTGNLFTTVVNTVNVSPADAANSEATDDPNKSMCVTLKGRTAINDKDAGKHIKITPNGRLENVLHARTTIGDASTETAVLCDAAGHLQIDIPATTGVKLEDLSSTIDADHANNSRSLPMTLKARQTIGDHTTGTYIHTDANGFLSVRDKNQTVIAPNLNTADDTQLPRNYIVLHDQTNNLMKSAKCDTVGQLLVSDEKGRFGLVTGGNAKTSLTASITETKQVVCVGLDDPASATSINPMKVDSDGHLQVDIVSSAAGGDASAANQTTMISHLSEIEGAVETVEGCVSASKLAVSSSQLPSTLGQKANSNSISICRSNTAGAFDLSGRTTIATASTSTKLLCNSDGKLHNLINRRNDGTATRYTNVQLENNTGTGSNANVTVDLGADHNYEGCKFYVNSVSPGMDLLMRVSADGTNWLVTSGVTLVSTMISGGATIYYGNPRVVNPPRYVQIYNNNNSTTYTFSEVVIVKNT